MTPLTVLVSDYVPKLKKLTVKKKRKMCERNPIPCFHPSLIAPALGTDVVFILHAAIFQSSSKGSISVVKDLRIEMENDSEQN